MEKKEINGIVARNIRGLMREKNLSNAAFSRAASIPTGTISKILSGKMAITIPMALTLAHGLNTRLENLFKDLSSEIGNIEPAESEVKERYHIGVFSIGKKRITSVANSTFDTIGRSELNGDLDLADSFSKLIKLINESVYSALETDKCENILRNSTLNLVMQSYEFEETRKKFALFSEKYYDEINIMSDWQITYITDFGTDEGLSLTVDKGVSLSYLYCGVLKKLGGWKFPVYDLGGENWLGVETIKHTIDAAEGFIPMTDLARNILSDFKGKIEKITEYCLKIPRDPDIYCVFSDMLIKNYHLGDIDAKNIVLSGLDKINILIKKADEIIGSKKIISINGSLAEIYKPLLPEKRIYCSSSNHKKVDFLAKLDKEIICKLL